MTHDTLCIQEVLLAEQAWTEAHQRLDIAAIEQLMADDYTHIGANGAVITREQALTSLRSQTRTWEYAQSDQLDVRIYGTTAIVIGRWTAKGVNNGEVFDYAARFASVYVQLNGCWQMVLDHATPMERS